MGRRAMNSVSIRAIFVSLVMIFSSLAGCLDDVADVDENSDSEVYGTVMVSTYHVEQLVSAIVGDTVTVQTISPSNKSKQVGSPLTFNEELASISIPIGSNIDNNLSRDELFSTI